RQLDGRPRGELTEGNRVSPQGGHRCPTKFASTPPTRRSCSRSLVCVPMKRMRSCGFAPSTDRSVMFARYVSRLRRKHPVFRREQFFFGRPIHGSEVKDLTWFRYDGREMTEEDWTNAYTRCFGLRLAGDAITELDDMGHRVVDDTFLVLLNGHHEPM